MVSIDGYRYFLTLVDDSTRFTWVYMLKQKSEVLKLIPQFCQFIHTQFNKRIKSFRCDNAVELKFTEFFKEQGIESFHSCVDRPQQNPVVERKHQHILNVARSLLFSLICLSFFGLNVF